MSNTPELENLIESGRLSKDSVIAYQAIVAERELQELLERVEFLENARERTAKLGREARVNEGWGTKLETYAIRELIECYGTNTNAQAVANKQLQSLLDKVEYINKLHIMNGSIMKESYAVLLHSVIDENTPQRATVIVTTDEGEDLEYHSVAECGVEDAWLVMGALQFQADIKYDKLLSECKDIAEQIAQENPKTNM